MTSEDPVNLCLCFLAKKMFDVPRTIARSQQCQQRLAL